MSQAYGTFLKGTKSYPELIHSIHKPIYGHISISMHPLFPIKTQGKHVTPLLAKDNYSVNR
jgi:hypothetical protein